MRCGVGPSSSCWNTKLSSETPARRASTTTDWAVPVVSCHTNAAAAPTAPSATAAEDATGNGDA